MKISKSLVLLSILAVLALPVVASAQNLLENGDFETGDLTGWLVFGETDITGVTIDPTDNGPSFPGSNNAYLANNNEALGLTLKGSTPAGSAGMGTVFYSFDLLLDAAANGGVLFVEIWAEQENGGILGGSGLMGPIWAWDDWVHTEGSFEAPEGTDFLTIQIMANTGAAGGSNCLAHADNVYLSQEGEPVAEDSASLGAVKALYR